MIVILIVLIVILVQLILIQLVFVVLVYVVLVMLVLTVLSVLVVLILLLLRSSSTCPWPYGPGAAHTGRWGRNQPVGWYVPPVRTYLLVGVTTYLVVPTSRCDDPRKVI